MLIHQHTRLKDTNWATRTARPNCWFQTIEQLEGGDTELNVKACLSESLYVRWWVILLTSSTAKYLGTLNDPIFIGRLYPNLHLKIGWGNWCKRRVLYKWHGENFAWSVPKTASTRTYRDRGITTEGFETIAKRTWQRQEDPETVLKWPLKLQTAHKVHEASQDILCEC